MDIKLEINGNSIKIGMTREQLRQAGFRKIGFFVRRELRKLPEYTDDVLWIKNPTLQCFGDASTNIVPMAAKPTNLDDICGTSVFVFLKNGCACYGILQVFQSYQLANRFAYHFRVNAFRNFWNCRYSQPIMVPMSVSDSTGCRDALMNAWEDESGHIVCKLDYRGLSCIVQWGTGAIQNYIENHLINVGINIDDISGFNEYLIKQLNKSVSDLIAVLGPRED